MTTLIIIAFLELLCLVVAIVSCKLHEQGANWAAIPALACFVVSFLLVMTV